MRSVLAALLVLVALASASEVIPVIENEFIVLHVGYPGTNVAFMIRWDLDGIYVRPDVDLARFSRTYNRKTETDRLCFGRECIRVPLIFTYALPAKTGSYHFNAPVSNFRGVIGLANSSPVWKRFRRYSYNANELVLASNVSSLATVCTAGSYVPITLDGLRYWAYADLAIDYTFMPPYLLHQEGESKPHSHWTLQLFGSKTLIRIERSLTYQSSTDGVIVSTLRPMSSAVMSERKTRVAALNQLLPDWNATDIVILGRQFLTSGFTVSVDTLSGHTALTTHWIHKPWLVESDYWWAYVPLVIMLFVSIFVIVESVQDALARDVALTGDTEYEQPARAFAAVYDPRDGVTTKLPPNYRHKPLSYPPELRLSRNKATSVASYLNPNFASAVAFVVQFTCVLLVTSIVFGYGFMHLFERHHFRLEDRVAVYSALAMLAIHLIPLQWIGEFPSTSSIWQRNALLLAMWLLAMADRFTPSSITIMIISSAMAVTFAIRQFASILNGTMWPQAVYVDDGNRRTFWFMTLGAIAVWWSWLFAFYTVPAVASWWHSHNPVRWQLSLIALALVMFSGCIGMAREFVIQLRHRLGALAMVSQQNRLAGSRLE